MNEVFLSKIFLIFEYLLSIGGWFLKISKRWVFLFYLLVVALNPAQFYSADQRRREKARVIVRTTAAPREAIVDTSGIFGFSGEFSEPNSPNAISSESTNGMRNPFRSLQFTWT